MDTALPPRFFVARKSDEPALKALASLEQEDALVAEVSNLRDAPQGLNSLQLVTIVSTQKLDVPVRFDPDLGALFINASAEVSAQEIFTELNRV